VTARTRKAAAPGPKRVVDPFDLMRANRALAPHDPKLNDIRWLIGEVLRRTYQRARLDALPSPDPLAPPRPASARGRACHRRRRRSTPGTS
jgi:hypothetical protein